jgi:hypothetical protein
VLYQLSYVGEGLQIRIAPSAGVPRIVADLVAHTAAILLQPELRHGDSPTACDKRCGSLGYMSTAV